MYDPNRWLKRSQYAPEPMVMPTRNNNIPISFNSAPIPKPKNNNNRKIFRPSPPRLIKTRKNRKASRKNRKTRANRR